MANIFNPEPGQAFNKEGQVIAPTAVEPADPVIPTEPSTQPDVAPAKEHETPTNPDPSTPAPVEVNWEEKTGGKFKSWDEINAKLTEQPTAAETKYANEQSRIIAQYIASGKLDDVRQVLNDQHRLSNLDKLSEADAVKLAMEFKNTQFNQTDITEEFTSKYIAEKPEAPNENDYVEDEAYTAAKNAYNKELAKYEKEQKKLDRQLKIDAAAAREELRTLKSDIVLPDITPSPATAAATEPAFDQAKYDADLAEFNRNRDSYLTSLNKSAEDFKAIPFTINDEGVKVDISYAIPAAEVAAIKKDLSEKNVIDDILLPRYDKGDVYDTKQLVEDIYWLNNKEKIMSNAIKQAIAQDRKLSLADRKNIDLDNNQRNDFTPSTEARYQEFGKAFINAG